MPNMTKTNFNNFLKNGYNKNFVKDWLDLAKSPSVYITNPKNIKNDATISYRRFNAYFIPFNYLVRVFNFAVFQNYNKRSLEEEISFFINQLTSKESEISLNNYNPIKSNNLSLLLTKNDNNSKIETPEDLFKNISLIHKKLFSGSEQNINLELLDECNFVLDEFFRNFEEIHCD